MKYESTKTYGHELGLSCCFRQHLAESHCNKLHGYALSFKFIFGTNKLTREGWVVDFGNLDRLKQSLVDDYDHVLVISVLDPAYVDNEAMRALRNIANVRMVNRTGCEAFAKDGYDLACYALSQMNSDAYVLSCEVREHGGNSAIFIGDDHG